MKDEHEFTWIDGERLIRFATPADPGVLAARGFDDYALLTTERAARDADDGAEGGVA